MADLYYLPTEIVSVINNASINPSMINLTGNGISIWSSIVIYAKNNDIIESLITEVLKQYPKNGVLLRLSKGLRVKNIDFTLEELPIPSAEKLVGFGGFLPSNFLSKGAILSKSVGRISIGGGFGTGFLIQGGFLLTNWHVIKNEIEAKKATVCFWYELGNSLYQNEVVLDPDNGFATGGGFENDDWTVVKIMENLEDLAKLGVQPIQIKTTVVTEGEKVNIIQHPKGDLKKVCFRNNIIYSTSSNLIHYSTDTLPGSSGSPIFNDNWDVVGIHHAGGGVSSIKVDGLEKTIWTNEGISINHVINGINNSGVFTIQ